MAAFSAFTANAGALGSSVAPNYDGKAMNSDLWCEEEAKLPIDRCCMLPSRALRVSGIGSTKIAAALLLLVAILCAYPLAARSQTLPEEVLEQTVPAPARNWDIILGTGIAGSPIYTGAKRYHDHPFFFGSVSYRNLAILGPAGLGANIINFNGFRAGPVIGYQGGRSPSGDPHLNGLGNLQPTIMAGAFIAYRLEAFELGGTFRQAIIHSNEGLVGRVQLVYHASFFTNKLDFEVGPEVDLGDGRYKRTWFGVSNSQSALSALPAFNPGGGVTDAGAHVIFSYRVSDRLLLRATGDVRQFEGDASHSPIIETKSQAVIGRGIGYHFRAG
jgi:outer membrane scaffolding protein for murein synthesis (MipA/OmpV family)